MRMMMSSVSAVALALMVGTTAMAGSSSSTMGSTTGHGNSAKATASQSATTGQGSAATSTSGSSSATSQSAGDDAMMRDRLEQAGVKNPQQATGYIVTAQGPDGQPVVMVITPENTKGSEVKGFDQAAFTNKLTGAGFKYPTKVSKGRLVRGDMDRNVALLVVGEPGWVGSEGASAGASSMNQPDEKKLKDEIGKAGISGADHFGGQVLRVDNGEQPAFLIIAPGDFKAGKKVAMSSDEQSKLDESGFSTMDTTSDIVALQGKMGGNPVIIFTGPGLTE